MFVSMATNASIRKRVVVKSKRPTRSSDSSTTDVPTDFVVDRLKQSVGSLPVPTPGPSSPCNVAAADEGVPTGVPQIKLTSEKMEKEILHEAPLPVVLQHPGHSSSQSPHHPPPGSRKKEDTSSSSSGNEQDEVFVNHPRQVFFVSPGNQLSPTPHYDHSLLEPGGQKMYGKGRKGRVAPLTPAGAEGGQRTPSPRYHSSPNTLLSSGSPHDDFSTISSTSSPLPLLLTANMRRGGAPYQDSSALLESLLPGKMLKVFVGTWNMCGQKELPESLNDFLLPLTQSTAADLYVIGTQESTANRHEWEVLVQQTLGPTHVLVHSVTLGVLYLILFLRRDLIWYCSVVRTSSYATRPVTLIRTKGGVGLSFTLFGSSFLFINSHLSAGQDNASERNSDFHRITRNLNFGSEPAAPTTDPPATPLVSSSPMATESHDHVFWCGDLNYRLELERKEVNQILSRSDLRSLLLHDQLTREILGEEVFQGYSEQPINFQPTYKYDLFSDEYDSSDLQRTPAWTDRVLFKSSRKGSVVGCGYNCCSSIKCSDHRPVFAVFKTRLNPCNELDGMPANPVSYNRELYIRGLKRRKKAASVSAALVQANASNKKQHVRRDSHSVTEQTSSAVCIIL